MTDWLIRSFAESDREAVISLWQECELTRPWNDADKDIDRKLTVQRELFLVAESHGRIVGSAMGGYDGHRGWVNYLAVSPELRGRGLGRELMGTIETRLEAVGCPKVNVQIRAGNDAASEFYLAIGYTPDEVVSFGKRLIDD